MKRFKKLLIAVLVMGMVIGGSVQCLATDSAAAPTVKTGTVAVTICSPLPEFMMSEIHQQNYLRYLVKEYDPASLSKWEKAFTARKEAKKQLEKMLTVSLPASAEVPGVISVTLPDNAACSCTDPAVTKAVTGSAGASGNKVVISSSVNAKNLADAEAAAPDTLYSDFEKAVELGDAKAIKAVLPKVLDKYGQVTEDMVKGLSVNGEKK